MKKNKRTYLALLLLLSFLSSFGLGTTQSLQGYAKLQYDKKTSISKDDASGDSSNNFIFEKTENESEQDVELSDMLLLNDFLFSVLQLPSHTTFTTPCSLEHSVQEPIYITIRNLRI